MSRAKSKAQKAPGAALLVMANMFKKAAAVLVSDPPQVATILPTLFLIHHAIELYLKAYLSLTSTVTDNHDIAALFNECRRRGYKCSDPKADVKIRKLKIANDGHGLRYIQWGKRSGVPGFAEYLVLLDRLSNDFALPILEHEGFASNRA